MQSRKLAIAAVLSLVMLAGAVGLWVRSAYVHDVVDVAVYPFSATYTGSPHAFTITLRKHDIDDRAGGYRPPSYEQGWRFHRRAFERGLMPDDHLPGYRSLTEFALRYQAQPRFGEAAGLGFMVSFYSVPGPLMAWGPAVSVALPWWFVTLASLVCPAWWLRRRLRASAGALCRKCRYDLRGNPDATACPECGYTITPVVEAPTRFT